MHTYISRLRKGNHKTPPPNSRERLIEDMREVKRQLEGNHAFFALESDEDLLDAAIYQREALHARYRYLLRLARENGVEADGPPVEAEQGERWIS